MENKTIRSIVSQAAAPPVNFEKVLEPVGLVEIELGSAKEGVSKILEISQGDTEFRVLIAESLFLLGYYEIAQEIFQDALEKSRPAGKKNLCLELRHALVVLGSGESDRGSSRRS